MTLKIQMWNLEIPADVKICRVCLPILLLFTVITSQIKAGGVIWQDKTNESE